MASAKGTVTPLSQILPLDQISRAAQKIQDAIREHSDKLEELKGFAEENKSLHKLIQGLPHSVSYNIMVPFGKAAFFPGKLVHTNELMVLLGESYYAERSAKQTLDVLARRRKFLESNIESLNTQIADLQAEAAFATNAASEAAAGVVDIREEYIEPTEDQSIRAQPEVSETGKRRKFDEDAEHDRIMARLMELEAEEAKEEAEGESWADVMSEQELKEETVHEDEYVYLSDEGVEEESSVQTSRAVQSAPDVAPPAITSPADLIRFEEWKKKAWNESTMRQQSKQEKRVTFDLPTDHNAAPSRTAQQEPRSMQKPANKAFTGSVVERVASERTALDNNNNNDTKAAGDKPEKPVSRFKQRLAG